MNLLSVSKSHFLLFCKYFTDQVETFFWWKVRQTNQNFSNSKFFIGSILENGFEAALRSKLMLWTFENAIFQFFTNFWVATLRPFSRKVRPGIQKCLNRNSVLGNTLENSSEGTSSSTTNVLNLWNDIF